LCLKLHHIGIVVSNIQKSLGEIGNFLQFDTISEPALIGSQKVNVCFLKTGDCHLEFIEPAEKDSPISNFVEKGGGLHHLCFEVEDIHVTLDKMIKNGARMVVEPTLGFENRTIAFLMLNMKNTNCNLIELAEKRK